MYWIYHKKHETSTTTLPIHVYINKIDNRLVFKVKDECKLEKILKHLLGSTKKLIDHENGPLLKVVEVVLVQCYLVDNQYHHSMKYYTFVIQINIMLIC